MSMDHERSCPPQSLDQSFLHHGVQRTQPPARKCCLTPELYIVTLCSPIDPPKKHSPQPHWDMHTRFLRHVGQHMRWPGHQVRSALSSLRSNETMASWSSPSSSSDVDSLRRRPFDSVARRRSGGRWGGQERRSVGRRESLRAGKVCLRVGQKENRLLGQRRINSAVDEEGELWKLLQRWVKRRHSDGGRLLCERLDTSALKSPWLRMRSINSLKSSWVRGWHGA